MRSERELARRTEAGIELRAQPLRLVWRIDDVPAKDGHLLNIRFGCSARALDTPTERAMLSETLLSDRDSVSVDDVVEHFAPRLRDAALDSNAQDQTALGEALRKAAEAVAFVSGL